MAPLGPWPAPAVRRGPPIAMAVSGGADSMALAVLAARWASARGLPVLALVVDHGLRADSAQEARVTVDRLAGLGIDSRLLRLDGLEPGPALAERARIARYDILTRACRSTGAVDLLLGHHAGDQAETVLMRRRAGSGPSGLAGIADLVETADLRLVRPLLRVAPGRLRALLYSRGIGWIEDPSNADPRALRTRLRQELAAVGPGAAMDALRDTGNHAAHRRLRQRDDASALAASVSLRPEGFALLSPELVPAAPLAGLIRTVGGSVYPPPPGAVAALLDRPRACTLAGTRLMPAGRFGPGWLLVREAAMVGPDQDAADDVLWDRRYRLARTADSAASLAGLSISSVGEDRAMFRARPGVAGEPAPQLPAAVVATLPALRRAGRLVAVPHLSWTLEPALRGLRFRLVPPSSAAASALFITA